MIRELRRGSFPINYVILAVHQRGLLFPLNDWTMKHILQGFSWRPGSVSFRTLDTEGFVRESILVDLVVDEAVKLSQAAVRIIKVPFDVGESGVEVTSPISDEWTFDLPAGHYIIFFSIEPDEEAGREQRGVGDENTHEVAWLYHITFVPSSELPQGEIIRADSQLEPPEELVMEAKPAGGRQ